MRCDYLRNNLTELDAWIELVNVKASGRTRYEGQKPYSDELAVAEIEYLREQNGKLLSATEKKKT